MDRNMWKILDFKIDRAYNIISMDKQCCYQNRENLILFASLASWRFIFFTVPERRVTWQMRFSNRTFR